MNEVTLKYMLPHDFIMLHFVFDFLTSLKLL